MDWIDQAQDRDKWRALVNTEMNFWDPLNFEKFFSNFATVASQEGLNSMELVK
jgi:hypothetical protein